jgi:hypothetical protein
MNFVSLRISGKYIDLEEITKTLNVSPKHAYKSGDIHNDKYNNQTIEYTEDCWIANIEVENTEETEGKILEFVDILYKSRKYIEKLARENTITLWISIYLDDIQYNLHFSRAVLSRICEMRIDVDITSMQLDKFYSEQHLQNNH